MCQDCNDALKTAAEAARSLAQAARDLYMINETGAAKALAKAAADLFTEVKEEAVAPQEDAPTPKGEPESGIPQGFHMNEETGEFFLNGTLVGRAVVIRKRKAL